MGCMTAQPPTTRVNQAFINGGYLSILPFAFSLVQPTSLTCSNLVLALNQGERELNLSLISISYVFIGLRWFNRHPDRLNLYYNHFRLS